MRLIRSVPVIAGAIGVAVAGAVVMLPWVAGTAGAAAAVLLMTHPSVGRVTDAPVRVLLRAIPLLVAVAIMLRWWELSRWRSAEPFHTGRYPAAEPFAASLDLDRYRAAYAAELLAAGCLILALVCTGAAVARSLRRPRPAAVALAVTGGFLLTAAAWAAVRIALTGGETLRAHAETAAGIEGGAFLQPGLRYSAATAVSAGPVLDPGSAALTGAALLGATLAVLAGARLATPDRTSPPALE
ncbi:hypothetical protein J2S43_005169 [Catenuloplanes nepalensis]|uniref:Uncharacterized protein n=1 Tax=Catenuloplanes nepalensis TaxID=587533 RepID=A0ABT9MYY3_9ACTN|nr:hypothetical protein [Catenuloplanes nepalensis]MDP9796657.1 hypothetical protein [Catenuloplanes nepalensis]